MFHSNHTSNTSTPPLNDPRQKQNNNSRNIRPQSQKMIRWPNIAKPSSVVLPVREEKYFSTNRTPNAFAATASTSSAPMSAQTSSTSLLKKTANTCWNQSFCPTNKSPRVSTA